MEKHLHNVTSAEHRYVVLLACTLTFCLFHAARQLIPPTLPLIEDEFGLTYTMSGLVAAAYDIGYGASLLFGAYLADRYGRKLVILSGLVWVSLVLISTGFVVDLAQLVTTRILTGIAFGMYFAAGTSLISSYFSYRDRGKALGIHSAGMGVGRTLTPVMVGLTIVQLGWRPQFFFVGAFSMVVAAGFWKVVKDPARSGNTNSVRGFQTLRTVVRNRDIAILGFCGGMMSSALVGVSTFLPLYLEAMFETGLASASLSLAIINAMTVPGSIGFGLLSDRFGRKATLIFNLAAGALGLFLFSSITPGVSMVFGIITLGLFLGTGWGVIIAFTADIADEAHRTMAMGWFNTIAVVSISILTILAGYASDTIGINNIFYFFGTISLIGGISLLALSEWKG